MPCDTRRTMTVDLNKCDALTMMDALNELKLRPMLQSGLIRFGYREWIDTKTGRSELTTLRDVNEIKQAYSRAVIRRSAKQYGWKIKQGSNQNQLELQRR